MMNDTVIRVENVSKKYCKELKHTMRYGIQDIAKNAIGLSSRSERLRDGEFWALNDVSFEVKKGESIGIIGANGSGKSTLLKLLNGIFMPDKGRIEISGKVGALIEVGAGFHPMLTGRENIYVNGSILGMSKKEIDKKFDEIVDFAGIGDFLDSPVKHYSSGMYVRLGFAVAVHCEPDILLVDEVLAVGDVQFQIKCFRKMANLKEMGKTIILVSHDMGTIQRHTERAMLLESSFLYCTDTPNNAINSYLSLISRGFEGTKKPKKKLNVVSFEEMKSSAVQGSAVANIKYDICPQKKNYNKNEFRYGNGTARIIDFELLDSNRREITALISKEQAIFRIYVEFYEDVEKPIFGIIVKTKDGMELYGNNTLFTGTEVKPQGKGSKLWIEYEINFNLQPGDYFLSSGIAEMTRDGFVPLDRRYDLAYISVLPLDRSFGIVNMDSKIRVYYA